jgi:hypothetical protein
MGTNLSEPEPNVLLQLSPRGYLPSLFQFLLHRAPPELPRLPSSFRGPSVIPDRLAETTGGCDPAHVRDFEEAIVDLRKGLNNIIIRRREPQLPGAHAGGGSTPNLIPSIQGITLVKRIPPQSLPALAASTAF